MADRKYLAQLLYLVAFYKRHDQTDVAIQLLQDFIKLDHSYVRNLDHKHVLAISLYNLAKLCSDEGDRLIATKLYSQAVDLWDEIEPDRPLDMLRYQGVMRRLKEETDRLVLWGAEQEGKERLDIA